MPVIEVTEFATLAKLAERCGQLVMHWSRSDVETFVIPNRDANEVGAVDATITDIYLDGGQRCFS